MSKHSEQEKQNLKNAALADLLQLQSLSQLKQAIGPYLIQHQKGRITHLEHQWSYDDYLRISVEWLMLANKVGLNAEDNRSWLKLEKKNLERLGLSIEPA